MNQDTLQGNWKQFKGRVKERWGRITNDQLEVIAGKKDQLIGMIQEAYGISREQAQMEADEFEQEHRDYRWER
jgi:uncharacterized protein YjbJ (UPF0337 family)